MKVDKLYPPKEMFKNTKGISSTDQISLKNQISFSINIFHAIVFKSFNNLHFIERFI